MSLTLNYFCYNPKSEKNYCTIFTNAIPVGFKVGAATIISGALVPYSLVQNSFMNRALEIGAYNIMQESFSPIKTTNYSDFIQNFDTGNAVNNPVYRGALQTNKYLPNLWVQNALKLGISDLGSSTGITQHFIQGFVFPASGMTALFMGGSIEGKIKDHTNKLSYTGTVYSLITAIAIENCITDDSRVDKARSNLLNLKDTILVSAGLVTSYAILDAAQISYNLLPDLNSHHNTQTEADEVCNNFFGIDPQEIHDWSVFSALTIGLAGTIEVELYAGRPEKALYYTGQIIGVSFAKAVAVTFVEISEDYINQLSFFSTNDYNFI